MTVLKFIHQFLDDNPLCVCSEEISKIKNELITENDKIILKQKTSQVIVKFKEQAYYLNARLTVPDKYPDDLLKLVFMSLMLYVWYQNVRPWSELLLYINTICLN